MNGRSTSTPLCRSEPKLASRSIDFAGYFRHFLPMGTSCRTTDRRCSEVLFCVLRSLEGGDNGWCRIGWKMDPEKTIPVRFHPTAQRKPLALSRLHQRTFLASVNHEISKFSIYVYVAVTPLWTISPRIQKIWRRDASDLHFPDLYQCGTKRHRSAGRGKGMCPKGRIISSHSFFKM